MTQDDADKATLRRVWQTIGQDYKTDEMVTLFRMLAKGLPE